MAKMNLAEVAREEHWWGFSLEGSQNALVGTGFVQQDWFPDGAQRDKRGRVVRSRKAQAGTMEVVCRQLQSKRFMVYFYYSEEERERRLELAKQRENYEKALAEEQKGLRGMPKSHEDFRAQATNGFADFLAKLIEIYCHPSKYHGYSYAPEVLQELDVVVQELRNTLETGRTIFSQAAHQARIQKLKAEVAAVNPDVRAFLDRVSKLA